MVLLLLHTVLFLEGQCTPARLLGSGRDVRVGGLITRASNNSRVSE
jgi:hypothetical protein